MTLPHSPFPARDRRLGNKDDPDSVEGGDGDDRHGSGLPLKKIENLARDQVTLTIPRAFADESGPTTRPARTGQIPGLPTGRPARPTPVAGPDLSFSDLQVWVLRGSTSPDAADRVWRYIGEHARSEGGDWNVLALALAVPGLAGRAVRLTREASHRQKRAVHHALAAEFLLALHRLDLDTPHVISRLIGAAYDHASGRKRRREPVLVDIDTLSDLPAHLDPHDQPGGALDEDVDAAVRALLTMLARRSRRARDGWRLTERHIALITRTQLDGEKLYTVATDLDLSSVNASKQRARAEMIIAHLLKRPDLLPVRNRPRPTARHRPEARAGDRRQGDRS